MLNTSIDMKKLVLGEGREARGSLSFVQAVVEECRVLCALAS